MPTPDLGPLIAGILADTIWSPHFPLRRAERLASISPKHDPVPRSGGIYRIHLEESASRTAARLNPDLLFSAVVGRWTENEREELKSDLLGLYMVQRKRPPLDQYEGEENATAGSPWPGEIQQGDVSRRRVRGV